MNLYASLKHLKDRLDIDEPADPAGVLLDTIEDASRFLDSATHRRFYPKIETRYYDFQSTYDLYLDDAADLLSVTTLTTNNTGTTLTSSDYFLMCGNSYNHAPYNRISINRDSSTTFGVGNTSQQANKVIGVFGYHDDYSNAWLASGITVNETFTSSDTTLTLSAGGTIRAGQTIQIESEWLYVSALPGGANITVERGVNGSTAASHASGTAISIYQPMRDVQRVAARFAAWLYKQFEAPFTFELQTDAAGTVIIPPNAPPEVHRFIKTYRRVL